MKISAFLPVYNEEMRIHSALRSLLWCDEIILLDKYSSDRTVEYAKEYGDKVKVFFMENTAAYDSSEWDYLMSHCKGEWIIRFTASDLMHPKLAENILLLINNPEFDSDIIHVPFRRYVLGIDSDRSPWFTKTAAMIFRKSKLWVDKNSVHAALRFDGKNYKMDYSIEYCMYHLTHETVDIMMDRHMRYWRGERQGSTDEVLKTSFMTVFWETLRVLFHRKSFLLGWDGVMLGFAYITYHMMSFVYKWERKRNKAPRVYLNIRTQIESEWESSFKKFPK